MYKLKQEYIGLVLEIIKKDLDVKFDTNIEPEDRYEYFYSIGFDYAFDVL